MAFPRSGPRQDAAAALDHASTHRESILSVASADRLDDGREKVADGRDQPRGSISARSSELPTASDVCWTALYPDEGRHPVDVAFPASPTLRLLVRLDGAAVGYAALVSADDGTAELKRMIVLQTARGGGTGHVPVEHLEAAAAEQDIHTISLGTGSSAANQPVAISGMVVANEDHSEHARPDLTASWWRSARAWIRGPDRRPVRG